jgi:hypothetical protein
MFGLKKKFNNNKAIDEYSLKICIIRMRLIDDMLDRGCKNAI